MLNRCTTEMQITDAQKTDAKICNNAKYAKCATKNAKNAKSAKMQKMQKDAKQMHKNAKNAKIAKKQKNAQQMLNYHIYGVKSMQVLSTAINIWHPKLCLPAKSFYKNPY